MNKRQKDELELLSPPGATILETLEEREMTLADLAAAMDMPRSYINDLI